MILMQQIRLAAIVLCCGSIGTRLGAEPADFYVNTSINEDYGFFVEYIDIDGQHAGTGVIIWYPENFCTQPQCSYNTRLANYTLSSSETELNFSDETETGVRLLGFEEYYNDIKPSFSIQLGEFKYEEVGSSLSLFDGSKFSLFHQTDQDEFLIMVDVIKQLGWSYSANLLCMLKINIASSDIEALMPLRRQQLRLVTSEIAGDFDESKIWRAALIVMKEALTIDRLPDEIIVNVSQSLDEIGFDYSTGSVQYEEFSAALSNVADQLEECKGN